MNRPGETVAVAGDPSALQWLDRIVRYRHDPTGGAADEIVLPLLPRLRTLAASYPALPRAVDREDVVQQLVLEVLVAAGHMRLPLDPRWIPRRLCFRARTYVGRWLRAEARQAGLSSAPLAEDLSNPPAEDGTSGLIRAVPSLAEFSPQRNHTQPTQKPRASGKFRGHRVWIKEAGTQKEGRWP